MAKDRGRNAPRIPKNPPKTGRAGKGPGNSVNKNHSSKGPFGKGPAKSPPFGGPGPHAKGQKPPKK